MQALRNSYLLTKMSLSVIRNDKRIFFIQLISLLGLATLYVGVGYLVYSSAAVQEYIHNENATELQLPYQTFGLFIAAYIVSMFFYYFSEAYISSLVLAAVRNQTVSLGQAISRVHRNARALVGFTLLSSTVGIVLKALEDRLPWAGKLATYVAQGAWNLATVFAVVTIVDDQAHTGVEATKRSVAILKNSFGENIVVRIGVGSIVGLTMLAWLAVAAIASIFAVSAGFVGVAAVVAGIGLAGLLALLFMTAALSSVLTVMLYEYTLHGNDASDMNKELFKSMITQKKAYSIFNHR